MTSAPKKSYSSKITNKIHFKDEIKRSFFAYALVPTLLFTLVIIVLSIGIWSLGIRRESLQGNEQVCKTISGAVNAYSDKTVQLADNNVSQIKGDKGAISLTYSSLKSFVGSQILKANFIILDSNFDVITQGNVKGSFVVPPYQKKIQWGALGRMTDSPDKVVVEVSKDYTSSGLYEIVIGRAVSEADGTIGGYVVFTVSTQEFLDRVKDVNTAFTVTNEYGNVFASTSRYYINEFGKLSPEYLADNGVMKSTSSEIVYRNDVCNGLLSVYTFAPTHQLKLSIVAMVLLTALMLGFIVVGMSLSATKIAQQKTQIIDQIVTAYQSVNDGNLDNRLQIDTNIEFSTIADSYNTMLDNIKGLISENSRKTKEKYVSEIKQLEMQFNPHFLFNTLDTIKYMIKLKPDDAQEMIINLSEILRYSIDNEKSMVRLGDDVMYIENYLKILKARFNKHFVYTLDIKPETANAVIPKLIIQPVIENAVKYGADANGELNISISSAIKNGSLVVSVRDTGCGLTSKEISEIERVVCSKTNETEHIGLYNVQRRIQLVFNDDSYGISIKSKKDYGTTVKIVMPYVNEEI